MDESEEIVAFAKEFGTATYEQRDANTLSFSIYFPNPMLMSLYNTTIKANAYIICPWFTNDNVQIGVTGTSHVRETQYDAMVRELAEETGMFPSRRLKHTYHSLYTNYRFCKSHKNPQSWTCYIIDITETEVVKVPQYIAGDDDPSRKVGCIMYGSEEQILERFREKIVPFESNDNIKGIMAIPKWLAMDQIVHMKIYGDKDWYMTPRDQRNRERSEQYRAHLRQQRQEELSQYGDSNEGAFVEYNPYDHEEDEASFQTEEFDVYEQYEDEVIGDFTDEQ